MDETSSIPPPNGSISQRDFDDYIAVIREALLIHYDREKVRDGLWKEYEAKDQVNMIKTKADRVVRSFEMLDKVAENDSLLRAQLQESIVGELLDIINYGNFAVRQTR
jgi:hypothetical protein